MFKYILYKFLDFVCLIKRFLQFRDFDIVTAEIVYDQVGNKNTSDHPFWKRQALYWDQEKSSHWEDITRYTKCFDRIVPPPCVVDYTVTIKYYYYGEYYKYLSRNSFPNHSEVVEHVKKTKPKFMVPIVSVNLYDTDGQNRDVTKKFKKLLGPRNDFHGLTVAPRDFIEHGSDEFYITVRNVFGVQYTFDSKETILLP